MATDLLTLEATVLSLTFDRRRAPSAKQQSNAQVENLDAMITVSSREREKASSYEEESNLELVITSQWTRLPVQRRFLYLPTIIK